MNVMSKQEIQSAITHMELMLKKLKDQAANIGNTGANVRVDNSYQVFRVVDGPGHKAITFAFRMRQDGYPGFEFGASDSGSAKQYSKKEGVALAVARLNSHNKHVIKFTNVNPLELSLVNTPGFSTRALFIESLRNLFGGINYRILSKQLRSRISGGSQ